MYILNKFQKIVGHLQMIEVHTKIIVGTDYSSRQWNKVNLNQAWALLSYEVKT